jgi:hypothetical protein
VDSRHGDAGSVRQPHVEGDRRYASAFVLAAPKRPAVSDPRGLRIVTDCGWPASAAQVVEIEPGMISGHRMHLRPFIETLLAGGGHVTAASVSYPAACAPGFRGQDDAGASVPGQAAAQPTSRLRSAGSMTASAMRSSSERIAAAAAWRAVAGSSPAPGGVR